MFNIIQIIQTQAKESASTHSINTISGNQTNLDHTVQVRMDSIQSNLLYSQSQQRKIEMMFATNTTYDPELRKLVISSHENVEDISLQADDLKLWLNSLEGRLDDTEALSKIQHEEQLKKNRNAYQNGFRYFDFAANALTNMVAKIAIIKGDKIDEQFKGLPTVNDDFPQDMGSIGLKNTPGWNFRFEWNGDNALRIYGEKGSVLTINGADHSELKIPGLPTDDFQVVTNDYKQALETRLKLMIAHAERSSKLKP